MNPIFRRLQLLFAHGKAALVGHQKIQARVLEGEVLPNIDRIEPYGFSYRPKPGAQAYLLFPAGDRSYGVAIVIGDKQYNMQLEECEVALHDDEGNYVHIKRGGIVEAKATTKVIADTPLFETTQDAKIGGNLIVLGQTSSVGGYFGENGEAARMRCGAHVEGEFTVNGKNVSDTHTHTGVMPGDNDTGEVN